MSSLEQLRIMRLATAISGSSRVASEWYRNEPLEPFDGKTADRLVSDGRADDVLRYLAAIAAGSVG